MFSFFTLIFFSFFCVHPILGQPSEEELDLPSPPLEQPSEKGLDLPSALQNFNKKAGFSGGVGLYLYRKDRKEEKYIHPVFGKNMIVFCKKKKGRSRNVNKESFNLLTTFLKEENNPLSQQAKTLFEQCTLLAVLPKKLEKEVKGIREAFKKAEKAFTLVCVDSQLCPTGTVRFYNPDWVPYFETLRAVCQSSPLRYQHTLIGGDEAIRVNVRPAVVIYKLSNTGHHAEPCGKDVPLSVMDTLAGKIFKYAPQILFFIDKKKKRLCGKSFKNIFLTAIGRKKWPALSASLQKCVKQSTQTPTCVLSALPRHSQSRGLGHFLTSKNFSTSWAMTLILQR